MKKENLLSKAEMRNVMGGVLPAAHYHCCYTDADGETACSACISYTTPPYCSRSSAGIQGVLATC